MPEWFECTKCGYECEEIWWGARRNRDAQWSDRDAVVVFRNGSTGEYRYPGQNSVPTPTGYERVVMRSLREVEAFEKQAKVTCEAMHYDSGSGTARPDDYWRNEKMTH
jgi:ribosomal protein L32E